MTVVRANLFNPKNLCLAGISRVGMGPFRAESTE